MTDSSIRLIVLFPHLLACCIALGAILHSDFKFLLARGLMSDNDREALGNVVRIASVALIVLWLTGLLIISIDFGHFPSISEWQHKPKLLAKVTVVCLLSLNGYLLHRFTLPHLQQKTDFAVLPLSRIYLMMALGAVSASSWLYSAFLGIARPLSGVLGYAGFMGAYVMLLTVSIMAAMLFGRNVFLPAVSQQAHRVGVAGKKRSRRSQRAMA